MTNGLMEIPKVQTLEEFGDGLHRGDVIGVRYDAYNRGFFSNGIIAYQTKHDLPYPASEVSHVAVVSSGKNWRAYSMQPPRGRELSIRDEYRGAQVWVLRYDGWQCDDQRYSFVDRAAFLANDRYSYDGILRFMTHVFPKFGGRFCSEQVEQAATDVGVNRGKGFIDDDARDVTPGELACYSSLRIAAVVWIPGDK